MNELREKMIVALAKFSMKDGAFLSTWNEKTGEFTISLEGDELLNELTSLVDKPKVDTGEKIDHSIDVRYESDVLKAFDKFVEKWCGKHKGHLLDDDENDGQYMREKIANLQPVTQTPNLEEIKKNLEEALPYTSSVLGELPIRDLIKFFIELFTPLLATKEHDEELLGEFRWFVNEHDLSSADTSTIDFWIKEFITSRKEKSLSGDTK